MFLRCWLFVPGRFSATDMPSTEDGNRQASFTVFDRNLQDSSLVQCNSATGANCKLPFVRAIRRGMKCAQSSACRSWFGGGREFLSVDSARFPKAMCCCPQSQTTSHYECQSVAHARPESDRSDCSRRERSPLRPDGDPCA